MSHTACVHIVSCNSFRRIAAVGYGALAATATPTRNIEGGNVAALGAQEAVIDSARINVLSSDRPERVDAIGYGALAAATPAPETSKVVMSPRLGSQEAMMDLLCSFPKEMARSTRTPGY